MANRGRSTLVGVAERAGVSIVSVSRVLNGLATSPSQAQGRAGGGQLDYVPDTVARSLKLGRTEQIAFAVADVGNPVYVSMMHAVENVVSAAGFRLVISSTATTRPSRSTSCAAPTGATPTASSSCRSASPTSCSGAQEQPDPDHGHRHPPAADQARQCQGRVARRRRSRPRPPASHKAAGESPSSTALSTRCQARPAWPGTSRRWSHLGLITNAELQVIADDFTDEAGLDATETLLAQANPDAIPRQRPARRRRDQGADAARPVGARRRCRRRHGRHAARRARQTRRSPASASGRPPEPRRPPTCCSAAHRPIPAGPPVAIAPSLTIRESSVRRRRHGGADVGNRSEDDA